MKLIINRFDDSASVDVNINVGTTYDDTGVKKLMGSLSEIDAATSKLNTPTALLGNVSASFDTSALTNTLAQVDEAKKKLGKVFVFGNAADFSGTTLTREFRQGIPVLREFNKELEREKTISQSASKETINASKKITDAVYEKTRAQKNANKEMDKTKTSSTNAASGLGILSSKVMGTALKLSLLTAVFKKLFTFIEYSFTAAGDYVEAMNLYTMSVGDFAEEGHKWAKTISDALYLDPAEIYQYTGQFFNLTRGLGASAKAADIMSRNLTQLSYDMSSYLNIDVETANNKLMSAMSGQTKAVTSVGVAVQSASLQELAYSLNINKSVEAMTQAEKTYLRYIQIMRTTTQMQGDLGRTIITPTNAMRLLKTQFGLLSRAIGQVFTPIIMKLLPIMIGFTQVLTSLAQALARLFGYKLGDYLASADNVTALADGFGDLSDEADKAADSINSTLAPFDELNVVQNESKGSGGGVDDSVLSDLEKYLTGYDMLEYYNASAKKKIEDIKKAFKSLGKVLKSVWDSKEVKTFINTASKYGSFLFDFYGTLAKDLVNNVSTTWSNIEQNFNRAVGNMSLLWITFWTDLGNGIDTWGQPIIDGVSNVFNSVWQDAFDPVIQLMTQQWADFSQILVDLWDEHGKKLIDNIGEFVVKTIDLFQSIWDNVINPIIKPFLESLKKLWDEHLKDLIKNIGDFVAELINDALTIYNKFIEPIVSWLLEQLKPAFSLLGEFIGDTLNSVLGTISNIVSAIVQRFEGIIEFITGVFTGDWDKAWQGVQDIFKGLVDGLVEIFKIPLNLIIDGINKFIGGLNKIKIPDWVPAVGGKGFHIDKLKKLEDGGFVETGEMFIAREAGPEMVGKIGNKTAVANNEQIAKALTNALITALDGTNNNKQPIHNTVYIGNKKVFDGMNDYVDSENDRYGTNYVRV